jgi:hypothetical protein
MRIKAMNQVMLRKTLDLRKAMATLMPKSRTYDENYEDELGRVVDKIRFRRERTLQKISQLKYSRANPHPARKTGSVMATVPIPMMELKNASEVASKQAYVLYL